MPRHDGVQLKIIFLIYQPKHMLWVLKSPLNETDNETVLLSTQNRCLN